MIDSIIHIWRETLRKAPDSVALIEGESGLSWTRSELQSAAEAWRKSVGLTSGIPGRLVIMAEPNGMNWFVVFLGLLLADAIPIPTDPSDPEDSLTNTAKRLHAGWIWHGGEMRRISTRTSSENMKGFGLVKLTSGSTGLPKARFFSHAQMIADGLHICSSMGIHPDDLNLGIIPFGHSYGLGNLVMPLFIQGTPVLCCATPLPNVLAQYCRKRKPTVFPSVPTLLRALVNADVTEVDFCSLRLVISAGAVLDAETAKDFKKKFGLLIHNFYGSSETGGICYDRSGEASLRGASVGTTLDGVSITFGTKGRFAVEGQAVMGCGRWSPPDTGMLNERGELVLLGRQGRIVKIAGRRLNLLEIETAIKALPGIRDALVVAHPSKADALAAIAACSLGSRELRGLLSKKLAGWKIPERLLTIEEFPVTLRGKTDRRKLEQLLGSNSKK